MNSAADTIDWKLLAERAMQVRKRAYAPYSEFQVGAALLTASGQIFAACNVENVSFGLSICAERSAAVQAVAAGQRQFKAMAICGPTRITPCGACRQFLIEFGKEIDVLMFAEGEFSRGVTMTTGQLLPAAFDAAELRDGGESSEPD